MRMMEQWASSADALIQVFHCECPEGPPFCSKEWVIPFGKRSLNLKGVNYDYVDNFHSLLQDRRKYITSYSGIKTPLRKLTVP